MPFAEGKSIGRRGAVANPQRITSGVNKRLVIDNSGGLGIWPIGSCTVRQSAQPGDGSHDGHVARAIAETFEYDRANLALEGIEAEGAGRFDKIVKFPARQFSIHFPDQIELRWCKFEGLEDA